MHALKNPHLWYLKAELHYCSIHTCTSWGGGEGGGGTMVQQRGGHCPPLPPVVASKCIPVINLGVGVENDEPRKKKKRKQRPLDPSSQSDAGLQKAVHKPKRRRLSSSSSGTYIFLDYHISRFMHQSE